MVERPHGFGRMRLLALVLAGVLAGCTTNIEPSASELKARWDAENVYPQRYRQDLLAFLRTYLNDPSHVRSAAVSQPQATPPASSDTHLHGVTIVDTEGALGQATPTIQTKTQAESLADAARRVKRGKPQ